MTVVLDSIWKIRCDSAVAVSSRSVAIEVLPIVARFFVIARFFPLYLAIKRAFCEGVFAPVELEKGQTLNEQLRSLCLR